MQQVNDYRKNKHVPCIFLGKNIINEQFLLNRLAQAAIDIYTVNCMLSRCTQSLNSGLASARHEELMTKVTNTWLIIAE